MLLMSCKGMVPLTQPGDYAFFWRPCRPIEGVCIIENNCYPYTLKIPYSRLHNRFITKKYIYLGNGFDYSEYIISQTNGIVDRCGEAKQQINIPSDAILKKE